MDRIVALRAAGVFLLAALVAGAFGAGAYSALAQAAFLISATMGVTVLAFGSAPRQRPVLARVRSRRAP